jgi:hypothetical protein
MAIRGDSYSSTSEVKSFTRHLLNGQSTWNSTTRPTLTDVEKFIDRASGVLNLALAAGGFTPSVVYANSTTKLAADDWTTARASEYAELTHRGVGYSDAEGSRTAAFRNLTKSANEFVAANSLGFVRLGVTQAYKMSDGLAFTGMDAQSERSDPDDTSRAQPFATRHQFDNAKAVNYGNSTSGR